MGFLDKAKQMAEQAQKKIDDAQKQFNEKQATRGDQASGAVRYDEHGRPVKDSARMQNRIPDPAAETPPVADPAVAQGVAAPEPADAGTEPTGTQRPGGGDAPPVEEPRTDDPPPPPPAPSGGANANPDPFKPLQ